MIMMTIDSPAQPATTRWWHFTAGVAVGIAALFTPWGAIVLLLLLGLAIYRLSRKPPRSERIALIVGIVVIILAFAWTVVGLVVTLNLVSTHSGTAVLVG